MTLPNDIHNLHIGVAALKQLDDTILNEENSSLPHMELMRDNLNVMIQQEKSNRCEDYLDEKFREGRKMKIVQNFNQVETTNIDESCREQICEWCYRVIDFFQIDRDVVYFAMVYLDRFLMEFNVDRPTYKLAATTALLLAMKVHSSRKINMSQCLPDLSRGDFDIEDIERMETTMIQTLSWALHPPSPVSFVIRILMLYNPCASESIEESDKEAVQNVATFFVELSVWDYYFITKKQSTIAFAAILNAIEGLGLLPSPQGNTNQSTSTICQHVASLCSILGSKHDSDIIVEARNKLWELYDRNSDYRLKHEPQQEAFNTTVKNRLFNGGKLKKTSVISSERIISPSSVCL